MLQSHDGYASSPAQSATSHADKSVADDLFPLIYDILRDLSVRCLRRAPGATLNPTALVHEAYLKMAGQTRTEWTGKQHFLAIASTVIRRVLVDYLRARNAEKRNGDGNLATIAPFARRVRITLNSDIAAPEALIPDIDLEALDQALDRLAQVNPRHARVVELRFFGGLTEEEIAGMLGVTRRTVQLDWTFARAWLKGELRA